MRLRWGPRRRSPRLLALGGGGPDLISALPDDLLLLVLARLECAAAAARTGVLSRRWRGLWERLRRIVLRDVPFHSVEPALARVPRAPPTVSLLEIRFPNPLVRVPREQLVDSARLSSLLSAAARLDPEELLLVFPLGIIEGSYVVDLPCFHRATSMVLNLESCGNKTKIRGVPAGVEFSALETLSLSGCKADFDALLSHCPRLRTLRLTSVWFDEGGLRINSPLLQELVVFDGSGIGKVNIVTPVLKKLAMSIYLNPEVSISVLAPMMEKILWSCTLLRSLKFGFWRVRELSLQTPDRQGQLRSLHIHAYIRLSTFYNDAGYFRQEIQRHMIAQFSVLELHLATHGHAFGAFVRHLLGMNRIRCSMQRLKIDLQQPAD